MTRAKPRSSSPTRVGPDGALYVTYREIAHQNPTEDRIRIVRSTDGGHSFCAALGRPIDPFDSTHSRQRPRHLRRRPVCLRERADLRALLEPFRGGRRRAGVHVV